jgi:CelD/BcsL family acetyltransferase involved in cellulose biosynthesis
LIPVAGSFDDYFRRLQHKFCKNVRAAERKALEYGPLEIRKPENIEALDELLAAGYEVEASGWKGRERTAINQVREAQAFYSSLAPDLYRNQQLDLRLLQCGGENLAFLYSAAGESVTRMLKIGINNKYRDLGPGMLMILHTAREFFEAGRSTMLDFCGGSARWKRDWSMEREKFYRLFIFRDNLAGTLLYRAARRISARRNPNNNPPAAAEERE